MKRETIENLLKKKEEINSELNEILVDKVNEVNKQLKEIQKITSIRGLDGISYYGELAELNVNEKGEVSFTIYID